MSSISMPGSKRTIRASLSKTAMPKTRCSPATPIASWASNAVPIATAPSASAQPPAPTSIQQDSASSASTSTPPAQTQAKKGKKEEKEYLWGSGSGVAAATDPVYGQVVFAEYGVPFNEADLTDFRPLLRRTLLACGQYRTHLARA